MFLIRWLKYVIQEIVLWWQSLGTLPPAPIFPSDLLIKETYTYFFELSNTVYKQLDDRTGYVDVVVPEDEWQKIELYKKAKDSLVIVEQYQNTNLDAQISQYKVEGNYFPIQEIIRNAYFKHSRSNNECRQHHRIRIPYKPEELDEPILDIDVRIYDQTKVDDQEAIWGEQQRYNWYKPVGNQANFSSEQIMDQVIKQAGFENTLIFEFAFQLFLPKHVCLSPKASPKLKKMSLIWPVNTSHNQVNLQILNGSVANSQNSNYVSHTIAIDPKTHSLTWQNIDFYMNTMIESNQFNVFQTLPMILRVNEPVELYQETLMDEIDAGKMPGEFEIEIPGLLSGLQIAFSKDCDYWEEGATINLDMVSIIQAKFDLFVENRFARRKYSPYQHLQFPSTVLSPMRLADIALLLKDMRFQVKNEIKPDREEVISLHGREIKREWYLMRAFRQEGGKEISLWIVVEGTPSGTIREREILGNEKYQTSLITGSTAIYIRGQINEDHKKIVETINLIHKQLKERFQHVNTIE